MWRGWKRQEFGGGEKNKRLAVDSRKYCRYKWFRKTLNESRARRHRRSRYSCPDCPPPPSPRSPYNLFFPPESNVKTQIFTWPVDIWKMVVFCFKINSGRSYLTGLLLASSHWAPDWFPFLPPCLALRMGAAFFMNGYVGVGKSLLWINTAGNHLLGEL